LHSSCRHLQLPPDSLFATTRFVGIETNATANIPNAIAATKIFFFMLSKYKTF